LICPIDIISLSNLSPSSSQKKNIFYVVPRPPPTLCDTVKGNFWCKKGIKSNGKRSLNNKWKAENERAVLVDRKKEGK